MTSRNFDSDEFENVVIRFVDRSVTISWLKDTMIMFCQSSFYVFLFFFFFFVEPNKMFEIDSFALPNDEDTFSSISDDALMSMTTLTTISPQLWSDDEDNRNRNDNVDSRDILTPSLSKNFMHRQASETKWGLLENLGSDQHGKTTLYTCHQHHFLVTDLPIDAVPIFHLVRANNKADIVPRAFKLIKRERQKDGTFICLQFLVTSHIYSASFRVCVFDERSMRPLISSKPFILRARKPSRNDAVNKAKRRIAKENVSS